MKLYLWTSAAAAVVGSASAEQDSQWHISDNQNAVYDTQPGVTPGVVDGGKTDTLAECQAKADAGNYTIFTWHDANQGSFANDCWFRTDANYDLTSESGHYSGIKGDSFDCGMKKLAYEFGKSLVPRQGSFEALYWALNLNGSDASGCTVDVSDQGFTGNSAVRSPKARSSFLQSPKDIPSDAIFVCAKNGRDEFDGSIKRPLRSLHKAAEQALQTKSRFVVLRDAETHYLTEQLVLTSKHSGLTIASYPGENAVVSGGKKINVSWQPHDVNATAGTNVYVADVAKQVTDVPGLQLDGVRATRARYPNLPWGIEASCGYGCVIPSASAAWTPPDFNKFGNVTFYTDSNPDHDRNDTANGWFQHYMIGINGLCSVYDPPVSYWCSEHPSGGGAFAFRTPSGFAPNDANVLPNSPYKDVSQAIINVWRPARWANWMFEVDQDKYDPSKNNFTFGYGGFQGARGSNSGGDFFVENVIEELDAAGEFFYEKSSDKLYLFYNATGAPPASMEVVVPQMQVLVNHTGTQWDPVKDVTVSGVTFRASAYTYMEPHGVPSAGDWALDRFGAVFLQGTENAVFDGCTFDRLDGNGVMISGYNRYATVKNSDFSFIGGNAVASWGYTNETATDRGRPGVAIANAPEAGVDGTDGEHPRYNQIISNTAREVGLYEKQSSFYVQAKTAESNITQNVFFNGPRAGINANDGFGGGDTISRNLVFSSCRESGDHGPFNSWDRQPFLTTVRDGTPSMTPAVRHIFNNFFIDNYSPQEDVDNDDGSSYYDTHDNFFVYGGNGMKNDFGGHDNYHHDNVYAMIGQAIGYYDAPMLDGHEDKFYNNKVVMTGTDVGSETCTGAGAITIHDNEYFTPTGAVTECKNSLAQWQAQGHDLGSTVAATPSTDTILGWAKEKIYA